MFPALPLTLSRTTNRTSYLPAGRDRSLEYSIPCTLTLQELPATEWPSCCVESVHGLRSSSGCGHDGEDVEFTGTGTSTVDDLKTTFDSS